MSKSWKIQEIKYGKNITCWNCNQKGDSQNQCLKLVASRDKDVNMAAGDSDDALVCCVDNTVKDRIMDSGASFHATYCKEELGRFKLHSGKDVRYIPGLKRRWIGEVEESFLHNVSEDKETTETTIGVVVGLMRTFSLVLLKVEPNIQSREHGASCRGSVDVMDRFSKYGLLNL
nr:retrovirus-related Pol polyprotein from transposon TNT 1-94 [Tanacetum cinerariifolium]